jgi:hypothetical protein
MKALSFSRRATALETNHPQPHRGVRPVRSLKSRSGGHRDGAGTRIRATAEREIRLR